MGTLENDLDLWIEAGTYPVFYITYRPYFWILETSE